MTSRQKPILLFTLTACTVMATTASASPSSSWKLYDLRDLFGLLPTPERVDVSAPPPSDYYGEREAAALHKFAPAPPDAVDELVNRLLVNLQLRPTRLFPGVYGIEGEEAEHATLTTMIEQVRSLYKDRYEVELLWYSVPSEQSPAIGDPVAPAEPLHRHYSVVPRRTPTEVAEVSLQTYISRIDPVVATGSVGYGAETRREESGLHVSILVGAGDDADSTVSFRINGELRRVAMGKTSGMAEGFSSGPGGNHRTGSMVIELPTVGIRSIRSLVHLEPGKPTTVAVVNGFGEGECIVVAASVRPLGK